MDNTHPKLVSARLRLLSLSLAILSFLAVTALACLSSNPQATQTPKPAQVTQNAQATPTTANTQSPDEIASQMDDIQQQVIALRGLHPSGEFTRDLLSPAQLRENVINDLLVDYTEEESLRDARVMAAFGLLDEGFDMQGLMIDLLSEQVAGYYDNETKEMYVVAGNTFGGAERLTYAHEYTHALQDQTYDIEKGLGYSDEVCEIDSEGCAAVQALLEGDATVLELQWFQQYSTQEDMMQLLEFYNNMQTPVFDSAPLALTQQLLFPYLKGQEFVQYLYDKGGWAAVDHAYRNLPVSTEQILHPERYPGDLPVPVELADLSAALGGGWEEIERGVNGEWSTFLILTASVDEAARLPDSQAGDAAEGWGGDAYAVFYNSAQEATALVLLTKWETGNDAAEFAEAFRQYATARFQISPTETGNAWVWESALGYSELRLEGDTTSWVLLPESSIATAIWQALGQ